jgi:hypothetical protein
MKKRLITLATTILIVSQAISQTSNKDSVTCIPNSQLKKAIELIEKSRVHEEEIENLKQTMNLFRKSVINKDSIITIMSGREIEYRTIMTNQSKQITNSQVLVNNLERNIEVRNKFYKSQKKKSAITALVGIVLAFFVGASIS